MALPPYNGQLNRELLTDLYSAKNNRPWGQRQKHLVEVAHRVANTEKKHLTWFMHAVRRYGRLETMTAEGKPGLWRRRHEELRAEYRQTPALFEPERSAQSMVEFLFPKLMPLP